jgi:predicted transcriptional regulator
MDLAARILDKLRQSPFSIEELASDMKRSAVEVRQLINALLREGSIVKLDTDRGGGPFHALAGYVEPADRLDTSDLVLGWDYSGQYEAPIWRDDA